MIRRLTILLLIVGCDTTEPEELKCSISYTGCDSADDIEIHIGDPDSPYDNMLTY